MRGKLSEITFFYIKAPQHTEIKVDGALGSPAPSGRTIAMSVYSERSAIPQEVVYKLNPDGTLGDEVEQFRRGKEGIVRSVQATLHMDIDQAKGIRDWLTSQINLAESAGES